MICDSCPKARAIFPKIKSPISPLRFMVAEIIREQVLVETERRGSLRDHGGDRAV